MPECVTTITITITSRPQSFINESPAVDDRTTPCSGNEPFYCSPSVKLLPGVQLPKDANQWKDADNFFKVHLVPRVCLEDTVDGMNHVLCTGIYEFFAKPTSHPINFQINTFPEVTNSMDKVIIRYVDIKES